MSSSNLPLSEETMSLGMLMEAAQAQQRAADSAVRKLRSVVNELTASVGEEARRVFLDELQMLAGDSRRAADALHQVGRAANLRVVLWSIGITSLCTAIPLAVACWSLPSKAQLAVLQARREQLEAQVSVLEQRGGRMELRRCGEAARLCVRVDRKAPIYGEQSDYLIVKGY